MLTVHGITKKVLVLINYGLVGLMSARSDKL